MISRHKVAELYAREGDGVTVANVPDNKLRAGINPALVPTKYMAQDCGDIG